MYALGLTLEFSPADVDSVEELEEQFRNALYEIEANDRSYSPFEFLARELNQSRDPDAAWAEFERGLDVGARKAWRSRKEELVRAAGLDAPQPKQCSPSR